MTKNYNPNWDDLQEISKWTYKNKYFQRGEGFEDAMTRVASHLSDNASHFQEFRDILMDRRFLTAGRILAGGGTGRIVTLFNCFVMGTIKDDLEDIYENLKEAAMTMKQGGGIGYDFSTLRPKGDLVAGVGADSSGPLSFMDVWNEMCKNIMSAGQRRGAMMGVMRCDHPDIEEFIRAKQNGDRLTNFNISIGVTDEFMRAVSQDLPFDLKFNGKRHATVNARSMFDDIMRSTWDYAEPGVIFLDTVNRLNNLNYCENIAATNPCGEQPLPPYGACLLGSFNLTRYLTYGNIPVVHSFQFDWEQFKHDIYPVVRAMDNINDRSKFPLERQKNDAQNKRRMGLGITGLADAAAVLGYQYGSQDMLQFTHTVLQTLNLGAYRSSVSLAMEKGAFPKFDPHLYCNDESQSFVNTYIRDADESLWEDIKRYGIRNSHLTSIAPTGTISLAADNISSGIEPHYTTGNHTRRVLTKDEGHLTFDVVGWAEKHGVSNKTADSVTTEEHLGVLGEAAIAVDSAVSKTVNVSRDTTFDEFKDIYKKAWALGAKGITTYRPPEYGGKRESIFTKEESPTKEEGLACRIDEYGNRTCDV